MRGGGNMNQMMKQMQKMQKKMMEAQGELEESTFEGSASNGLVKVTVSSKKEITDVEINPEVVDPDDVELLQDMIIIAVNNAMEAVDKETSSKMGQFTKGLNIPGL